MNNYFIIDFDSTFVSVEALDELARIALAHHPEKKDILQQIQAITAQGMEGKLDFPTCLIKRLTLFQANRTHIKKLVGFLKNQITPSVLRNKEFFDVYKKNIYIISGGFTEYILPVVHAFGITEDHVLANTFTYNDKDIITGFDTKNPLAQQYGKAHAVATLGLKGNMYVVGDGYTDYSIKEKGLANKFYAFTENVHRDSVAKYADYITTNLDELLFHFKLPRSYSYPKSKMKILLLENINKQALEAFQKEGYQTEAISRALSEKELIEKIADASVLGIRSKTEITASVLEHAKKLLAIGAFCIGTNQINLQATAEKGIIVFNAPYSNTRSVAEMIIGEIIMLSRNIFEKSSRLHQGIWDKSASGCHEIRGRKLGIIGYGHIGSQVSVLAEAIGMDVYYYNTSDKLAFGNAKKCNSMEELLKISDVVTIHVSGRQENKNLIGKQEFAKMKDGVLFLNASRGFVVDIEALTKFLKNGKIAGAAVDVYPKEPEKNGDTFVSTLQNLPNVILTPHIGSGTEEGQHNIGEFVSSKLIHFINTGSTTLSVNFPQLQLPDYPNAHRFIHIHQNTPGMLAQINTVLAKEQVNVEGQYLKTNEDIGYVITDINKNHSNTLSKTLKQIPGTIKVRMLY